MLEKLNGVKEDREDKNIANNNEKIIDKNIINDFLSYCQFSFDTSSYYETYYPGKKNQDEGTDNYAL